MGTKTLAVLTLVGLVGSAAFFSPLARRGAAKGGFITPVKSVTITMKHPGYKQFSAEYALTPGKRVYLHDTDYWVTLQDFVCDFTMDAKTHEVISRSNELRNPAALIALGMRDQTIYLSWIFQESDAPHQVRAPGFDFTIAQVQRR